MRPDVADGEAGMPAEDLGRYACVPLLFSSSPFAVSRRLDCTSAAELTGGIEPGKCSIGEFMDSGRIRAVAAAASALSSSTASCGMLNRASQPWTNAARLDDDDTLRRELLGLPFES